MIRNFLTISLCYLTAAWLTGCGSKGESKDKTASADTLTIPQKVEEVVGLATVEPQSRIVSLYAEAGGIIREIRHDINDHVNAGEVIVQLNSDVEEAQLAQARSKLATQQSAITTSRSQLASQKVKLENAKVNLDRNTKLLTSGGVTQQSLTDSKFSFESMTADVESAASNVSQQENKIKELQADVNYYQKLVDRKKVKAPLPGRILSMDVKIGNNLGTNQSICDFAPDGPLIAITEIDELFASQVQPEMTAYIRPQGKTEVVGKGKVIMTSPYLRKKSLFADNASNMEDRRVREVRVLLDSTTQVLIGSRVECVIELKK